MKKSKSSRINNDDYDDIMKMLGLKEKKKEESLCIVQLHDNG